MTYEDYMNHAKKLYLQGVDASGEQRRYYLTQALNNTGDGSLCWKHLHIQC